MAISPSASYSPAQKRVVNLLANAEPREKLRKWTRGYIPKHYKRINIGMEEAVKLAKVGAMECMAMFGTNPFFTQALLMGAVASGKYKTFVVVTPSQYGKSWLCSQIAIYLAGKEKKEVHVTAGTEDTTAIIMKNVMDRMQEVDESIQSLVLDFENRIEKLQSSTSKKKLTFKGGGLIDVVTLGVTSGDAKQHNRAIGRGGAYILDEAAQVPEDAYAEMGRREFSNVDGEKEVLFQISNPHKEGLFYDKLTQEVPPKDTLVIWMDVRTALEEGRITSVEQVIESDFFRNKSTCQRYFLCELEDYADESMFGKVKIDDSPVEAGTEFFLGVDSAYRGKDSIQACLVGMGPEKGLRVLDIIKINKGTWVDGVTSGLIVQDIRKIVDKLGVKAVNVDIGFGVYLNEGLAKAGILTKGINFGAGTTKSRVEMSHFSAKYGANMRAELHLDLQQLMDSGSVTFTASVASKIAEQLEAVRSVPKPNGKTAIISKDEIRSRIGHSPDELDAVLLAIHAFMLYNMDGGIYVYREDE